MNKTKLSWLAVFAFGLVGAAPAHTYKEGQVWEYQTRPGDEGSLLRIQKIEPDAHGSIYHISVIGVHFHDLPLSGQIVHMPVSERTLDASVTLLSSSSASFPDASEGIEQWRSARGGVFTVTIAEAISLAESTVRGGSSQPN